MAKKQRPRRINPGLNKNQLREVSRWETKAMEAGKRGNMFEMHDCLRRADKLRSRFLYANERRFSGR